MVVVVSLAVTRTRKHTFSGIWHTLANAHSGTFTQETRVGRPWVPDAMARTVSAAVGAACGGVSRAGRGSFAPGGGGGGRGGWSSNQPPDPDSAPDAERTDKRTFERTNRQTARQTDRLANGRPTQTPTRARTKRSDRTTGRREQTNALGEVVALADRDLSRAVGERGHGHDEVPLGAEVHLAAEEPLAHDRLVGRDEQRPELGHEHRDAVVAELREEVDLVDDVAVDAHHHLRAQRLRQLAQDLLLVVPSREDNEISRTRREACVVAE